MIGKLICWLTGKHKRRRRIYKDGSSFLACPRCGDEKAVKQKA